MKYTLIICFLLAITSFHSTSDKETVDWTGTTQGESDSIIDIRMQQEQDSIDDYMRYWYEVLDTNSDGDIDDIE